MKKIFFALFILPASMFAQTTCVNCGGLTNITEVPGTSVTSTVPLLFPDGAVGAPSISFTNNATWGLWRDASGIEASMNGVNYWRWTSAGEFHINGNASGTTGGVYIDNGLGTNIGALSRNAGTGGTQLIQNGASPLIIALGASGTGLHLYYGAGASTVTIGNVASAAPAARALTVGESSRGGTDSNVKGANGTIKFGNGTGTAGGADGYIQAGGRGASGTTADTYYDKQVFVGLPKALTESSATSFVDINVASGAIAGGVIEYCVFAEDGTDKQARCGDYDFAVANKAGTMTCSTPNLLGTEATALAVGTLTAAATFISGTNKCSFQFNAVSSLTQTILEVSYQVTVHGQGTVSPL